MTLADLKEKILETFTPYWERLQESSIWQKISEQYESLSPRKQKIVKITVLATTILGYLLVVYSLFLSPAYESIEVFENNQRLIRELFAMSQKITSQPKLPPPIPVDFLKTRVEQEIINLRLLPEQKGAITPTPFALGNIGPKDLVAEGLVVELKQLNIRQIVEMAFNLQSLQGSPTKLLGLEIHSSEKDSHYFDAKYSLAMFSLPETKTTEAEDKKSKHQRNRFNKE